MPTCRRYRRRFVHRRRHRSDQAQLQPDLQPAAVRVQLDARCEHAAGVYAPAAQRMVAYLNAPLSPRRSLTHEDWRARLQHHGSASPLQEAWVCLAELEEARPQRGAFGGREWVHGGGEYYRTTSRRTGYDCS